MNTFSDTWMAIVNLLKANANAIGVAAAHIDSGKNSPPGATPAMYVDCFPVPAFIAETGGVAANRMAVEIAVFVFGKHKLFDAISECMSIAEKTEVLVLRNWRRAEIAEGHLQPTVFGVDRVQLNLSFVMTYLREE